VNQLQNISKELQEIKVFSKTIVDSFSQLANENKQDSDSFFDITKTKQVNTHQRSY
jgi:hypothetical protein